ncbi:MAG: FecR domain-containing protein [Bacteroidota bacterium]
MKNDASRNKLNPEEEKGFFARLEVPYAHSKAEVWQSLEEKTNQKKPLGVSKSSSLRLNRLGLSIAASMLLFISLGLFARLYQKQVVVLRGETAQHVLPDGSEIFLNAETRLSYAPYWWMINRQVGLAGEAFFSVQKGSKFKVKTKSGTTEVLGTQFNVYTRMNEFRVYCQEGKVSVSTPGQEKVILQAGDYSTLENEKLNKSKGRDSESKILAWKRFIYNTTPLKKVFEDFERQYDVKIQLRIKDLNQRHYTGVFEKTFSVDEALQIVCRSENLYFKVNKKGSYIIRSK